MAPLTDVRILDLSRVLAGPYCTQLLADLGATVWKVEPPSGEDTRAWGPPFADGESGYFLSVNRGKRGLAVDLKDSRGRDLVRRLALQADVVVENFKLGDLARYGLAYEQLAADHPRLVYCSITGFGQDGPRASEPGYDAAIQALSGVMAMTGEPGRPPVKLPVAWIDVLAGLHASVAILAALRERDRTGVGRRLDVALFDVALASLVNQAQGALLTGEAPLRRGSAHPNIVPYQAFDASDGALMLAVGNDRQFRRLCDVLGRPEWAEDDRFRTNAGRVEHRDVLVPRIAERVASGPRDAWIAELQRAGVPATPVGTVLEALADPQAVARGAVRAVRHAHAGEVPALASALRFAGAERPGTAADRTAHDGDAPSNAGDPAELAPDAPPALGEHTRAVLAAVLGLSDDELDVLAGEGVVTAPDR